MAIRPFALAAVTVAFASCHLLIDTRGLTDGDGGGSTGGDGGRCSSTRGPVMIDTGFFCIDGTETTRAQYAEFVADAVGFGTQPTECTWNQSWGPALDSACPVSPELAVECVDWCDARAYCQWAGKRLCGRRGSAPFQYDDPAKSEWMFACSGGVQTYPYGSNYVAGNCNTTSGTVAAPGASPLCKGFFDGLLDMSGNLKEWDDFCTAGGATAMCHTRGGSYDEGSPTIDNDCAGDLPSERNAAWAKRGIRCCRDFMP